MPVLPVDFPDLPGKAGKTTERGKEDQEDHVFILWGQFKYPVGVVLTLSGERSPFGRLFWRWSLN